MAEWERYDQVGSAHKNGDRMRGFTTGYARDLMTAGTPTVSSLLRSSITPAVSRVDIGMLLQVAFEDDRWWVSIDGERVGRLTWSIAHPDFSGFRDGVVEVQRVFVNAGVVVNLGGVFLPA